MQVRVVDEHLRLEHRGGVGAQPGRARTDLEAGVGAVQRLALFAREQAGLGVKLLLQARGDLDGLHVAREVTREGTVSPPLHGVPAVHARGQGGLLDVVLGPDFVQDRTHDGRKFRMLTVIDEYTRECLTIHVGRRINSNQVIDVLADAMIGRDRLGYDDPPGGPHPRPTYGHGSWSGVQSRWLLRRHRRGRARQGRANGDRPVESRAPARDLLRSRA